VFSAKIKGKHFSGNQIKFFFNWKVFFFINFSNDRQTQESFENDFQKINFREINGTS
jgi:hypothetical protein